MGSVLGVCQKRLILYKGKNMGLFKDGWDGFVTDVRDFNDGLADCDAELQATNNATQSTITYYGAAKNR